MPFPVIGAHLDILAMRAQATGVLLELFEQFPAFGTDCFGKLILHDIAEDALCHGLGYFQFPELSTATLDTVMLPFCVGTDEA